ncbi:hypothetical protein [Flavobacterium sp. CECT 9288]|nr:hypothetical protein [Flavobacterium sp. CECT 9288]
MYTKTKDCTDDGKISKITIRTHIGDIYGSPLYVEKIKNSAGP